MVLDRKINFINYFIIGLALLILGIIQLIFKENIYILAGFIIGASLLLSEFKNIYSILFDKNSEVNTFRTSLGIVFSLLLLFIPNTSLIIVSIMVGSYFILQGIIKLVHTILLMINDIYIFRLLVEIIFLLIFGIFIIFTPIANFDFVLFVLSVYFIFLGIGNINDALKIIIPNRIKNKYKRKIRITPPAIITAVIPLFVLKKINEQLELNSTSKYKRTNYSDDYKINILVHLRDSGFDSVGHLDIYFNNEVISYGNYDSSSRKLFNTVGDGILFKVKDKSKYIDFCIKNNNKTIVEYEIKLNAKEYNNICNKLNEIETITYSWKLPKDYNKNYYAYILYNNTKAIFYKFNKSKFKTYFNFTTNCAMFVDTILKSNNNDILNINGIITPGTYYTYLDKELSKKNGIVVKKTIYR